jgi:hypothetical protein
MSTQPTDWVIGPPDNHRHGLGQALVGCLLEVRVDLDGSRGTTQDQPVDEVWTGPRHFEGNETAHAVTEQSGRVLDLSGNPGRHLFDRRQRLATIITMTGKIKWRHSKPPVIQPARLIPPSGVVLTRTVD